MPPRPTPPVPPRPTPQLKTRRQRTGSDAFNYTLARVWRGISDRPAASLSVIVAVAIGVAIAIAIIAASNGINTKITSLLSGHGDLQRAGVDVNTINQVLIETRDLLTNLAIGFTAALVALVTWVTMNQRRREIGIARQQGQHVEEVIFVLLAESFLLCVAGGIGGIILGNVLCGVIQQQLPLLPVQPSAGGVLAIFPTTTLLSFGATAAIAAVFASRRDVRVTL